MEFSISWQIFSWPRGSKLNTASPTLSVSRGREHKIGCAVQSLLASLRLCKIYIIDWGSVGLMHQPHIVLTRLLVPLCSVQSCLNNFKNVNFHVSYNNHVCREHECLETIVILCGAVVKFLSGEQEDWGSVPDRVQFSVFTIRGPPCDYSRQSTFWPYESTTPQQTPLVIHVIHARIRFYVLNWWLYMRSLK